MPRLELESSSAVLNRRYPRRSTVNSETADERSALHELAGCLKPLFEQLSREDQAALTVVEFEGLTQVDAAHRLGLSTSGMKSRVQRARHRLKGLIEACCRVEQDRRGGIISFESRAQAPCKPCGSTDCRTNTDHAD